MTFCLLLSWVAPAVSQFPSSSPQDQSVLYRCRPYVTWKLVLYGVVLKLLRRMQAGEGFLEDLTLNEVGIKVAWRICVRNKWINNGRRKGGVKHSAAVAWGDHLVVMWNPDKADRWKCGGVDSWIPELYALYICLLLLWPAISFLLFCSQSFIIFSTCISCKG